MQGSTCGIHRCDCRVIERNVLIGKDFGEIAGAHESSRYARRAGARRMVPETFIVAKEEELVLLDRAAKGSAELALRKLPLWNT